MWNTPQVGPEYLLNNGFLERFNKGMGLVLLTRDMFGYA